MARHFDAKNSLGLPQHSYCHGEYVPNVYGEHDTSNRERNHVNMGDQRLTVFGQERGHGATPEVVFGEGTSIPKSRSRDSGMSKISHPPAQLTVFYAGTVSVYDNVPADKAQALMQLAESGQRSSAQKQTYPPQPQYLPQDFWFATAHNRQIEKNASIPERYSDGHGSLQELRRFLIPCEAIVPKALPIARKASLARFLEKRKERLMAPYLMRDKRLVSAMQYGLMEGGDENEGSSSGFNIGNADENSWHPIAENSQASECESAT